MIRTPSKIEYLDHIFISENYRSNYYKNYVSGVFICQNCNLRVCISMYDLYISSCSYLLDSFYHSWKELDLTCNEVVIKNIIE